MNVADHQFASVGPARWGFPPPSMKRLRAVLLVLLATICQAVPLPLTRLGSYDIDAGEATPVVWQTHQVFI
eukprot:SAG31_NODE_184_length_20985_cov_28.867567_7_plen_71_part_00